MIPVTNFSHVCIGVTDIDRSVAWYREHLGFDQLFDVELGGPSMEAVTGDQGAAGRMVGGMVGGVVVELLSFAHEPRTGYTNTSFRVEDLDAAHAAAADAGAVVAGAEPPQAAATMATIPAATIKARGPER